MIIKEIYINNFGKFNDFTLSFDRGINIIYGDNESGKTTILNFILMILYGSTSKSNDISKNERKKYYPWNSNSMGGYIILERLNIEYKIERNFNKTNSSDDINIYEVNTGKIIKLSSNQQPGEYFFNLSVESFKRTFFISSESIVISNDGKDDELTRKLVNLVTTGEENLSIKEALSNIDSKIEELKSKRGDKGVIVDLEKDLEDTKLEIEQAIQDEKDKEVFKLEIKNIEEIKNQKNKEYDEMYTLLINENERKELINKKKDLEIGLLKNHSIVDLENKLRDKEKEKIKIENNGIFSTLKLSDVSIFISLILGIIALFTSKLILILSAVFMGIYFLGNKKKLEEKNIAISNIDKDILQINQELNKNHLMNNAIKEEINLINEEVNRINKLFINKNISKTKLNTEYLNEIKEAAYEYDKKIESIKSLVNERYRGKKNLSTLEEKFLLLQSEKEKIEARYLLLQKTREFILNSFNELEVGFSKILNNKTSDIIKKVTKGKYDSLLIDNDFNISIIDGKTKNKKEWKYLSSGTIDQIYLSLRMAIAELVVKERKDRILLLDDILIRYDIYRAIETLNLLNEKSSEYAQILLFTCNDIKDLTDESIKNIRI